MQNHQNQIWYHILQYSIVSYCNMISSWHILWYHYYHTWDHILSCLVWYLHWCDTKSENLQIVSGSGVDDRAFYPANVFVGLLGKTTVAAAMQRWEDGQLGHQARWAVGEMLEAVEYCVKYCWPCKIQSHAHMESARVMTGNTELEVCLGAGRTHAAVTVVMIIVLAACEYEAWMQ